MIKNTGMTVIREKRWKCFPMINNVYFLNLENKNLRIYGNGNRGNE